MMRVTVNLIVLTMLIGTAAAAEKPTGADFLRIEPSARAAALGGGFSAMTDDVHALYYNPAGLTMVGKTQLTATHTEWIAGMQNEYVALAVPLSGPITLGFSTAYLHSEEIERDAVGRKLSTFGVADGAFTTGLGLRLTERNHIGLSAKYLMRTMYHRSAGGFAADLGYQYRYHTKGGSIWKAGASIRNIGPDIGFAYKEKLPTELEVAAAWLPSIGLRRLVAFTFALKEGTFMAGPSAMFGVEGTLFGRFYLRAGYATVAEGYEKLRVGFGVDLFDLGRIDFAAIRIGQFDSNLFLSLTLQLAGK